MASPPLVLPVLFAALLVYSIITDTREYRRFNAVTETRARQHFYLVWAAKPFLAFAVTASAALAWLGRLNNLIKFPGEFTPLLKPLRDRISG